MQQFLLSLFVVFCLVACGERPASNNYAADTESVPTVAAPSTPLNNTKMAAESDVIGGAEQSLTEISEPTKNTAKKYIALRHQLQIESPADKMQAVFDAAINHCKALNCQLESANYNKQTTYNPPSASISVRVPPRNVAIFLTGLAKNGDVIQHGRESEDKTIQVIDADARIKNLTELRDRLRIMMKDNTAKIKDLIEIEVQLANTQGELDSIKSIREALSFETDLVAVNINFTASQGITEQGTFAPVARAFKDAGSVLMESFGSVITFVFVAIPWLLIGIPVLWLIRRYWVKIKAKFK